MRCILKTLTHYYSEGKQNMMQLLSNLEKKAQRLVNSAFVNCSCNKGPKRLKTSVWLSILVTVMVLVLVL